MNFSKGYYSLIQYCPDPGRQEAANIGVLLFCPDRDFLSVRMSNDNARVRQFFGCESKHWRQINLFKAGIVERFSREARQIKSLDQLQDFIDQQANLIRITDPRPMRVTAPEANLEKLFDQLVGKDASRTTRKRFSTVVAERFNRNDLKPKLKEDIPVELPDFPKKQVRFPFGFQNGNFNVIQPVSFTTDSSDDSVDRACRLGAEGDSLANYCDETWGPMELIVVGRFKSTEDPARQSVRDYLESHNVKLYTDDKLNDLAQLILATGKDINADYLNA